MTNMKSHKPFQMTRKSSTSDDLEGSIRTPRRRSCVFRSPSLSLSDVSYMHGRPALISICSSESRINNVLLIIIVCYFCMPNKYSFFLLSFFCDKTATSLLELILLLRLYCATRFCLRVCASCASCGKSPAIARGSRPYCLRPKASKCKRCFLLAYIT